MLNDRKPLRLFLNTHIPKKYLKSQALTQALWHGLKIALSKLRQAFKNITGISAEFPSLWYLCSRPRHLTRWKAMIVDKISNKTCKCKAMLTRSPSQVMCLKSYRQLMSNRLRVSTIRSCRKKHAKKEASKTQTILSCSPVPSIINFLLTYQWTPIAMLSEWIRWSCLRSEWSDNRLKGHPSFSMELSRIKVVLLAMRQPSWEKCLWDKNWATVASPFQPAQLQLLKFKFHQNMMITSEQLNKYRLFKLSLNLRVASKKLHMIKRMQEYVSIKPQSRNLKSSSVSIGPVYYRVKPLKVSLKRIKTAQPIVWATVHNRNKLP